MATITHPHSPRALVLSALLHAVVIGLVVFFTWWSQRREEEVPQIFELVAGEGDDYAALEAPTTAAPSIKVDLPDPLPVVQPQRREAPAPKIEPAPEPKVQKEQPKEKAAPTKVVEKKAPAPKVEKVAEKAPAKEASRMTLEEFRKAHGAPKTTTAKAAPKITPKKINADSIAGRVASDSTNSVKAGAGGTVMSRAEADLWAAYQAMIIQRIRRAMQAAGMTELRTARVEFRVSADGVVSAARITGSSGSSTFDAAVLSALRSIGRLGPPPTGQAEALSVTIDLVESR